MSLLSKSDWVMDKNEIALLIQKFNNGQASDKEKEMLDKYWQDARNDTSVLEEMSADSREELKKKIFHSIKIRLGLK